MKIKTPHWLNHGIVALIITLITMQAPDLAVVSAGLWFYIGREIRDWEKLHNWNWQGFDWQGIVLPLVVTFLLFALA